MFSRFMFEGWLVVDQQFVVQPQVVAVGVKLFGPEGIDADIFAELRMNGFAGEDHG